MPGPVGLHLTGGWRLDLVRPGTEEAIGGGLLVTVPSHGVVIVALARG